ncbi:MAG TPA: TIGR00282 family metallophosphoesterase [Syntrophorhabdaceae bacterium]|nr:TIGR00282 family metallophosphoesterase [Syntrophorhabdaceae bacterium]HOL05002.1 TIGR00282 family metallophosphoesterase [Syntrophorhabdaceae bacterium]HPC66589.1 TIGR00282 family metallophosphoesterase [Syntrophorhabdaceae bacterium]HPP41154.1 TIGR00282 family metallophosphoesterase [Syntrophorhabdaceae bacterium]HQE80041.1 TIGR00282 family metallophosphoesterase [Syntrophorhabdaceae bacterium]
MQDNEVRVFFLGDVIGKPGRKAVEQFIKKSDSDFFIINGENLAGGIGITPKTALEILSYGVDAITTGNHVWKKKEIIPFLMEEKRVLRPLNYPRGTPGFGYGLFRKNNKSLYVVNIEGRVFMNHLECPFRSMEDLLDEIGSEIDAPIFVDFHAEATSEKIAMGWFLDGKVSAVIGTHTHVQTSDSRVLPNGTGYITDAGMTGSINSVIGMDKKAVLEKFITLLPQKYEVGKDDVEIQGVSLTIDIKTKKCLKIEAIREKI